MSKTLLMSKLLLAIFQSGIPSIRSWIADTEVLVVSINSSCFFYKGFLKSIATKIFGKLKIRVKAANKGLR